MRRTVWILPVIAIGLVAAGWFLGYGHAQDDAPTVRLPSGWARIGLDPGQKAKIYEVRRNYRKQIRDLEVQILDLKKKERSEMIKVLTPEQKDRL